MYVKREGITSLHQSILVIRSQRNFQSEASLLLGTLILLGHSHSSVYLLEIFNGLLRSKSFKVYTPFVGCYILTQKQGFEFLV